jgi:hypothetical protein
MSWAQVAVRRVGVRAQETGESEYVSRTRIYRKHEAEIEKK